MEACDLELNRVALAETPQQFPTSLNAHPPLWLMPPPRRGNVLMTTDIAQ